MIMTLSEQVDRLVSENQHLRVKSDNDDITRQLLKEQYDALAGSVENTRTKHEREMHLLRTERDQAVIAFKEIDTLLLQAADMVMQATRRQSTCPKCEAGRSMTIACRSRGCLEGVSCQALAGQSLLVGMDKIPVG